MRVLIACEFSGIVREAFRKRGHDAWSCDLLPSEIPSAKHYQQDISSVLYSQSWDLIIAFPPCTDLSWANGALIHKKRADGRTQRAADFVTRFIGSAPKLCVENPNRGDLRYHIGKPNQVVEPWMFGEMWRKQTGLWLWGLEPLVPSVTVQPINCPSAIATTTHPEGFAHPGKARDRTFQGIANAMAKQWG